MWRILRKLPTSNIKRPTSSEAILLFISFFCRAVIHCLYTMNLLSLCPVLSAGDPKILIISGYSDCPTQRLVCDKHKLYKPIRIHHEFPCRIGNLTLHVKISTREEALTSKYMKIEGDEIFLSNKDWLMTKYFSATFSEPFRQNIIPQ